MPADTKLLDRTEKVECRVAYARERVEEAVGEGDKAAKVDGEEG